MNIFTKGLIIGALRGIESIIDQLELCIKEGKTEEALKIIGALRDALNKGKSYLS